jgi:arylsulfatase A-like enzyme
MTRTGCLHFTAAQSSRRAFLQAGSLGFLGINLPQMLRAADAQPAKGKAQSCILLWLEGGPSQMDTWDPKPSSAFKAISTNVAGIQVSELLPQVARRMDKLALVRSMHTKGNDHPQGTHYAITGHEPNPAMHFPSLGAILAKETGARNGMPPHVLAPQWERSRQYEEYFRAGFLGADYDPMAIPDPSRKDFEVADLTLPKSVSEQAVNHRQDFLKIVDQRYRTLHEGAEHARMDRFTEQAWKMLLNPKVRDAFDLSKESEKLRDRYGRDAVGQSALLARRLVEAGTRFVTAAGYHSNSWDTHAKNDEGHRDRLCPTLDRTLSALLDDLDERGLLDSTIVLAMGEFGRTPFVNPDLGRDHWPTCWSLALGGGGIKGGQVIGSSDAEGANVTSAATSMGDVFATIYKAFGIDWMKEYETPIGRPIKIANALDDSTGAPIQGLL